MVNIWPHLQKNYFLRYFLPSLLFSGLVLLLAYQPLWRADFLFWDDDQNIILNPLLRDSFFRLWRQPYFGLYVPVTLSVWKSLWMLGDGSVLAFRLLNLCLHLLNVLLASSFFVFLARRWNFSGASVFLATCVFAFHPLQMSTVGWLSGARDLLAFLFSASALIVVVRTAAQVNPSKIRKSRFYGLATVLYVASLLAKPNLVTLGLVVLLLQRILKLSLPRVLIVFWLFCGMAISLVTWSAQLTALPEVHLWQRPLVALDSLGFYIGRILLPINLSPNYAHSPDSLFNSPWLLLGRILLLFVICGGLWLIKRRGSTRFLHEGVALTAIWPVLLLPVSGLFVFSYQKISTTADHYLYASMVIVGVLAMVLIELFLKKQAAKWLVSLCLVGPMIFLFNDRASVYASNSQFFQNMAQSSPTSYSTGIGMSVVSCREQTQYAEGVRWTDVALRERSGDVTALANKAYCLLRLKDYESIVELEKHLPEQNWMELKDKMPRPFSSLLSSIGTAQFELGHNAAGFFYICEALRIWSQDDTQLYNLAVAQKIMTQNGLSSDCRDYFKK